jgi:hypothetical protein
MGSQSSKTPWGSPSTLALSSSKANPRTRAGSQDTPRQLGPNHPGTTKQTEDCHTVPSPLSGASPGHACAWSRARETRSRRGANRAPPMAKGAPRSRATMAGRRRPTYTRGLSKQSRRPVTGRGRRTNSTAGPETLAPVGPCFRAGVSPQPRHIPCRESRHREEGAAGQDAEKRKGREDGTGQDAAALVPASYSPEPIGGSAGRLAGFCAS